MDDKSGATNLAETERRRDASTDSVGVDRLRGKHEIGVFVEIYVDIIAVAVPGGDSGVDRLEEANHSPSSRPILRVTDEALLSNNRDGISRRA